MSNSDLILKRGGRGQRGYMEILPKGSMFHCLLPETMKSEMLPLWTAAKRASVLSN